MSYDTQARRDTPLALKLKQRIARDGAIPVDTYMRACLYDPEHGYYMKRPAIGAGGDFITAPEISQVFGELIGLWCAVVWQQMGSPAAIRLTELGPGRGTLIADALRAARVMPAFVAALDVELVETNEVLIENQRQTLGAVGVPLAWTDRLNPPPPATPWIILANEFLDTIPVRQIVWQGGHWIGRTVVLDAEGQLQFGLDPRGAVPAEGRFPAAGAGAIDEMQNTTPVLHQLVEHAGRGRLAALFIDYGHTVSALGDTLQAVRQHRFEHPLTSPGEADLTCQVDFQQFADKARGLGLSVDGPVTQAEFLGSLGLAERTSRLMSANPARAGTLEVGVARLMSPTGMGTRFKVIGLRSPALPPLPAFPWPSQ